MSLPAYEIAHTRAHKDQRGEYRAETSITIAERYRVRVLTMKRQDGVCRTTARCTRQENAFEGERDYYRELRSANVKVTRNAINSQHFAAVFDLRTLVLEIAKFYGLTEK